MPWRTTLWLHWYLRRVVNVSSPTLADALSVFHSATGDRRREVRGGSPCQGGRGVRPIFIDVSNVPKVCLPNVLADKRGTNRDRYIHTSCAMFNAVFDEHRHVTQRLRYCMRPMINIVPDYYGCSTSSLMVHGANEACEPTIHLARNSLLVCRLCHPL